ncbi:hypothetical protein [Kitasatospora aureofaciens]|uniref:hypothetical protein n=1 Tax=Kitasatospora aureofaciens TaxID=1894 RepID=UPI00340892F2
MPEFLPGAAGASSNGRLRQIGLNPVVLMISTPMLARAELSDPTDRQLWVLGG